MEIGIQSPSPRATGDLDECTWPPENAGTWTVKKGKSKKILVKKTKRGQRSGKEEIKK